MAMTIAEANQTLTAPGQMFEMEEVVIGGVPTRTWKHAPPSLRQVLELSRGHGDKDFLVYEDERVTFEQHFRQAAQFAHVLRDRYGIANGDRVAIVMRNFPEWIVAFWGAAAAGAVVVPLNAWWTADELEFGLADSGSSVVVADAERMERLRGVVLGDGATGVKGRIVVRADTPPDEGWERWDDVLGTPAGDVTLPAVDIAPEDEATIFYTSGTTGRPKGALGTHRNICTNLMSLFFVSSRQGLRGGDQLVPTDPDDPRGSGGAAPQNAYLLSVPLFHATGCHSVLVTNTAAGGKLVMMHKWDATRALELVERERVTILGGVPAMAWQVVEHPDIERYDTSSVRSVSYGGAPAAPELVRLIKERFPKVSPGNGYGLTETSSVTTMNTGDDYVRKPDSVGPPVPVCDVQVVDDAGRPLAPDEVGELWIRGPNVVKGYWNRPDATAETITDGWLHTGDVARIDDEGFVYIVDRAKDMVIRGGENVYCVEVESALYEHPAVSDAAVFGVPHKILGEEVGAAVQVSGDVTVEELQDHVRARLADFKVPAYVDLRADPLPRNPQGKILKRELREELASRWSS